MEQLTLPFMKTKCDQFFSESKCSQSMLQSFSSSMNYLKTKHDKTAFTISRKSVSILGSPWIDILSKSWQKRFMKILNFTFTSAAHLHVRAPDHHQNVKNPWTYYCPIQKPKLHASCDAWFSLWFIRCKCSLISGAILVDPHHIATKVLEFE